MYTKRLSASKHYPIERKSNKFVVSARPGPHSKNQCIPLLIIIRDVLKHAKTNREARKIIKAGEVKVDGIVRKDQKYPVGIMDVIEIPKTKEHYRVLPKKGKLIVNEIKKEESVIKPCQIKNKTTLKGKKLQLNLHDGRNILIPVKDPKKPKEDVYKVGDTLIISLPNQKIKKHIKMEKGSLAMITGGKYTGNLGKIKEIIILKKIKANRIKIERKEGEIKTLKDYAFVIGKDKAEIILL